MTPADTIYLNIQRGLSGAARLQVASDMSTAARELALAGLRQRHPEWPDRRLRQELAHNAVLTQLAAPPSA